MASGYYSLGSAEGRWILATTVAIGGLSFLVTTAVGVAVPVIQYYFNASLSGVQWVLNSYLLALAALLLIGGSLGDYFGRRRILLLGIALFVAGAVFSALAASIGFLIVFQSLQGVGAALMIPQGLAIINSSFKEDVRGRVIGLWAGLSGGISALGPWLGGWLVDSFSWQAVFWMTVPVAVVMAYLTFRYIPENKGAEQRRLNWFIAIPVFLSLFGLAYGLVEGGSGGFDRLSVLASIAGGIFIMLLTIIYELRQPEPMIQFNIFRSRLVAGANLATLLLYFSLYGIFFFLVLNLQQIQGYSPTTAGLALMPLILLITLLSGPGGALADRVGPRWPMMAGALIVSVGTAWLAFDSDSSSYLAGILPGLVLVGLGMSLVIAPLTKSALLVAPRYSGSASGINNSVSRLASLMAVAILGAIALASFSPRLSDAVAATDLSPPEQQAILEQSDKLGGIVIPESFSEESREAARDAIRAAFSYSFRRVMLIATGAALGAAVLCYFFIAAEPRRLSPGFR